MNDFLAYILMNELNGTCELIATTQKEIEDYVEINNNGEYDHFSVLTIKNKDFEQLQRIRSFNEYGPTLEIPY